MTLQRVASPPRQKPTPTFSQPHVTTCALITDSYTLERGQTREIRTGGYCGITGRPRRRRRKWRGQEHRSEAAGRRPHVAKESGSGIEAATRPCAVIALGSGDAGIGSGIVAAELGGAGRLDSIREAQTPTRRNADRRGSTGSQAPTASGRHRETTSDSSAREEAAVEPGTGRERQRQRGGEGGGSTGRRRRAV